MTHIVTNWLSQSSGSLFSQRQKNPCVCTENPGFRKGAKMVNKMTVCPARDLAEYGKKQAVSSTV